MNRYILDANAVIAFLEDRPGADIVERLLHEAEEGRVEVSISSVNWAEVFYVQARKHSFDTVTATLSEMQLLVSVIAPDAAAAVLAARLKYSRRLGLADAFAAALAMQQEGCLVSSDEQFTSLRPDLRLLELPHHKS